MARGMRHAGFEFEPRMREGITMDTNEEIQFLTLLDDTVVHVIADVAIKEPLIEVSAMIQGRISKLRSKTQQSKV